MKFRFIVPDTHAFVSGGNIYNRNLIKALRSYAEVEQMEAAIFFARKTKQKFITVFDSIYLDRLEEAITPLPQRTLLLLHYLPLLSEKKPTAEKIRALEKLLLRFEGWIVTGDYTRNWLTRHMKTQRPILLLPPAIRKFKTVNPAPAPPYRVLVSGNFVPVKGLVPLLRELEKQKPQKVQLLFTGNHRLDPAYAQKIQETIQTSPYLSRNCIIRNETAQSGFLKELGTCHLLVSASRFESFGMSIHEALYSGIPVWALPSGNIRHIKHPLLRTFSSLNRLCAALGQIPDGLPAAGAQKSKATEFGWGEAATQMMEFLRSLARPVISSTDNVK